MNISPESTIRLLKAPLEQDQENQLTFADLSAQTTYFKSLSYIELTDCSYQRETGRIRFNACIDDIRNYNYLMYQNTDYSNKWFYAFITGMEYASDNVTFISFSIDVIQTYYFDFVYKPSFVEREHAASDTLYSNIILENLDVGDFIAAKKWEPYDFVQFADADKAWKTRVVFGTTVDAYNPTNMRGGVYDNIPSGVSYYGCDIDDYESELQPLLQDITNAGKAESITGIFILPRCLCWLMKDFDPMQDPTRPNALVNPLNELSNGFEWSIPVLDPYVSKFGTYTPKNKKLYNSEFTYFLVSNSAGNCIILKPELGAGQSCGLKIYGTVAPSGSCIAVPLSYAGQVENFEESLTLAKYPQLNYATDQYTNWLAVNSWALTKTGISAGLDALDSTATGFKTAMNIGTDFGSAALNLMSGNLAGGLKNVGSGINNIVGGYQSMTHSLVSAGTKVGDIVHEKKMAQRIPPNFGGNAAAGDVMAACEQIRFKVYEMQITEQYARRIDSYFDMFGYQVNQLKTINFNSRVNWNYIKTSVCNIIGDVPQWAIDEAKAIFNKGLTFWHNPSTFLDYSQSNSIVS